MTATTDSPRYHSDARHRRPNSDSRKKRTAKEMSPFHGRGSSSNNRNTVGPKLRSGAGGGDTGSGGVRLKRGKRRRNTWRKDEAISNDAGKRPSNPRGWPDRSDQADLDARPQREITVNGEQEYWFCSNFVRTSKYTSLDFLPRFLMEEFHPRRKMANVYFLVLASLQTIPEITNTFRVPTILLPLSAVIIVDAFFAIVEDVARHRADAKANASPTRVLDLGGNHARFRKVEWSDVRVGDMLLVKNRESIPADLLVIAAHEPNREAKAGICYVETKSLDGETNLKIRQAVRPTIGMINRARDVASLRGKVQMEHPDKLIDSFRGAIEIEGAGAEGGTCREAIQPRNLLLRGCVLRNTPWVVGLVLNTGNDTKIIMSSMEPPHKTSLLEQLTNVEVWRIVRLLCFVCFLGAVGGGVWTTTSASDHVYLMWDFGSTWIHAEVALIQFFYLFLLLGNFIPVSLYVSMSTVKFCQSFFMKQDLEMYHEESDTAALVRTMALNEELGQVSHVFSDKTGTLTQNVMEFRKFSVGGISYGRGVTDIGRAVAEGLGEDIPKEDLEAERIIASKPSVPHVRFYDPDLQRHLEGAAGDEQRKLLAEFFLTLSVCHTVIPERSVSSKAKARRPPSATAGSGNSSTTGSSHRKLARPGSGRSLSQRELGSGGLLREITAGGGAGNGGRSGVGLDESKRSRCMSDDLDYETEGEGAQTEDEREGNGDDGDDEEEGGGERQPKLSASSPDDEALVLGARFFGMEFRDRVDNSACIRRSGPFVRDAHAYGSLHGSPRSPAFFRTPGRAGSASYNVLQGKGHMISGDGSLTRSPTERFVDERYQVLRILDFTSKRKRMSVIVRDPRGRVRILCKGADSIMIPRLATTPPAQAAAGAVSSSAANADADATPGNGSPPLLSWTSDGGGARLAVSDDSSGSVLAGSVAVVGGGNGGGGNGDAALREEAASKDDGPDGPRRRGETLRHMEIYAREGLRTLLVASADLEADWFAEWDKRFEAASTDINELEKKKDGKPNSIDDLCDEVETNLRLLGCTAIEDKLQDGVGQCVESLQRAGVKVWMLTGDKEETAINIGVACQLLGSSDVMERIIINMDPQTGCRNPTDLRARLEEECQRLKQQEIEWTKGSGELYGDHPPRERALIVDGQALTMALAEPCRGPLAALAMECTAVVCCRVSPDQKREVVALLREVEPSARTLAIGDGANDVAMIQGAHIGIGISGQEGMQAVNASDFAIAQFRFLKKLMLFHGRQNYRRMSKLVVYTFYKNILMAMPMAWYVVMNGYSGQKFYTEGGIQLYNVLFTLVPILFLGCFDRDVTLDDTDRFPGLYLLGINNVFFNPKVFWSWIAQATGEAALITFVPLALLKGGPREFGTEQTLFMFGATTFTLVVLLANSKILWLQYRWTMVAAGLVVFSISAWFGVACAISSMLRVDPDFHQVFYHLLDNPSFWAVVVLCLTTVFMRDLTWKFFHRWWQPKLHHIILEAEAKGSGPVHLSAQEWAAASARATRREGRRRHSATIRRRLLGTQWRWIFGLRGSTVRQGVDVGEVSGEVRGSLADSGGDDEMSNRMGLHDLGWGANAAIAGGGMSDINSGVGRGWGGVGRDGGLGAGGLGFSADADLAEAGHVVQQPRGRVEEGGLGLSSEDIVDVGMDGVQPGLIVGGGSAGGADGGSGGGDSGGEDGTTVEIHRNNTDIMSRPSSFDTAGEDVIGALGYTTPRSMSRSCSWSTKSLPLEPHPPLSGSGAGYEVASLGSHRSRSRRRHRGTGVVGVVSRARGTPSSRQSSDRIQRPCGGFAYSTDEASASLESDMILNYVESPLTKTPAFWDTRRPGLDRLVRRRDEGLLPTGYGTGRWTNFSSSSAGPRLHPDTGTAMGRSVSMDRVGNRQVVQVNLDNAVFAVRDGHTLQPLGADALRREVSYPMSTPSVAATTATARDNRSESRDGYEAGSHHHGVSGAGPGGGAVAASSCWGRAPGCVRVESYDDGGSSSTRPLLPLSDSSTRSSTCAVGGTGLERGGVGGGGGKEGASAAAVLRPSNLSSGGGGRGDGGSRARSHTRNRTSPISMDNAARSVARDINAGSRGNGGSSVSPRDGSGFGSNRPSMPRSSSVPSFVRSWSAVAGWASDGPRGGEGSESDHRDANAVDATGGRRWEGSGNGSVAAPSLEELMAAVVDDASNPRDVAGDDCNRRGRVNEEEDMYDEVGTE